MNHTMTKKNSPENQPDMKDRNLIEQMEALEEIVEWLESKDDVDIDAAADTVDVDEGELSEWLKSPKLKKVRKWIEE